MKGMIRDRWKSKPDIMVALALDGCQALTDDLKVDTIVSMKWFI